MPGSTTDLAIPYAIPTDPRAEWPVTNLSMSERIEALIRGAEAVVVTPNTGLAGVGTVADPLKALISDVFGVSPLDKYGTNLDFGLHTYVDAVGNIRGTPQVLDEATSPALTAAAVPGAWPIGQSILRVTAASPGWPTVGDATVVTIRRPLETDTGCPVHQWWYRSDLISAYSVKYRAGAGSPSVWGPWVDVVEPLLPDPVDAYNGADQTITSTVTGTETPTAIRATIVNPHPTRRMLARIFSNSRVVVSGTIGLAYTAVGLISGSATTAIPNIGTTTDIGRGPGQTTVMSEYWVWIPAGATVVAGLDASRSATTITMVIRYNHVSIAPIRYE